MLPGTAFVDMVIVAGKAAGCPRIGELTVHAPLVLPADGGMQVQVTVGGSDQAERRTVEMHARASGADGPWTRYASGWLGPAGPAAPPEAGPAREFAVWPPPDAVPVDTRGLYTALAAGGVGHGPSFRGLRAVWQRGEEVFAEAALPADVAKDAGGFGVHPALLDAVLHAVGVTQEADATGEVMLPFAWSGVSVHAAGVSGVAGPVVAGCGWRVVARGGRWRGGTGGVGGFAGAAAGGGRGSGRGRSAGCTVRRGMGARSDGGRPGRRAGGGGRRRRAGPGGCSGGARGAGAEVRGYADLAVLAGAVAAGEPVPEVVLACAGASAEGGGVAGVARAEAGRMLGMVQQWLGLEQLGSARLVSGDPRGRGGGARRGGGGSGRRHGGGPGPLRAVGEPRAAGAGRPPRPRRAAGLVRSAGGGAAGGGTGAGHPGPGGVRAAAGPPVRRTGPARGGGALAARGGPAGTLDGLALAACEQAAGPLGTGQVRVAVRAAGLNFRDVLISLDIYPGGWP